MTKSMKPVRTVPLPISKEDKAKQMAAFLAQKKEQLFQGCLYSLLSNPAIVKDHIAMNGVVDTANGLAEIALKKMYNLPDPKEDK